MPGVFRPYTLVDVLGTLNQESVGALGSQGLVAGTGFFAATNEEFTLHDTVATTVQANPTWDNGFWGQFTWG